MIKSRCVEQFLRGSVALLFIASLGGCGSSDETSDEADSPQQEEDTKEGQDDELADLPEMPEWEVQEVPFAGLVSQPFRWKSIEYQVTSARQVTEVIPDVPGTERSFAVLEIDVTNLSLDEVTPVSSWDLVLSDESREDCALEKRDPLQPEQDAHITVRCATGAVGDLVRAHLQPYEGDLGRHEPLQVPLDQSWTSPEPLMVNALVGQVFETQDQEVSDQIRVNVLSAEINVDSLYDGGRRAPPGKKYLDVWLRVYAIDVSPDIHFSVDNVAIEVGGYGVPKTGEHGVINENESAEFQVIFELDEDVEQFRFTVDTGDEVRPGFDVDLRTAG